jgi:DNA-binding transcriptional regulator GbsR (MarR family)
MASFGLFLHHFIEMADTCGLLLTAGIIYATLFHADDVAAIECRGMHEDFSS